MVHRVCVRGGIADVEVIIYAINISVRAEVEMALQKKLVRLFKRLLFP